jgi:uncharacterized protein YyaL (SSP411 family)
MLTAIDFSITKPKQIIIAGLIDDPMTIRIQNLIHNHYIPNKTVVLIDNSNKKEDEFFFPYEKDYILRNNKTTVYICEDYKCLLPTSDLDEVAKILLK